MRTTAPPPVRERTRSPPPPAPAPHAVARLQRAAGNRAVTAFLQRQAVETAPQLSAGQAAHAVSFYTGRPELYPTDVIAKIQRAVGSPETGVPDQAMAQAVARWQFPQGLKPDGMAGPRTLPRMFESGLAAKEAREAYVKTAEGVQSGWQDLKTAKARADELFKGVKAQLDQAQVAPTPKHDVKDLGKVAGVFVPKDWIMFFDDDAFSAPDLDDDAARSLAGTVYHEARHAEQNHKALLLGWFAVPRPDGRRVIAPGSATERTADAPPLAVARPDDRADGVRLAARRGERRATSHARLTDRARRGPRRPRRAGHRPPARSRTAGSAARAQAQEVDGVVRDRHRPDRRRLRDGRQRPGRLRLLRPDRVRVRARRRRAAAQLARPGRRRAAPSTATTSAPATSSSSAPRARAPRTSASRPAPRPSSQRPTAASWSTRPKTPTGAAIT